MSKIPLISYKSKKTRQVTLKKDLSRKNTQSIANIGDHSTVSLQDLERQDSHGCSIVATWLQQCSHLATAM
ncbi:hypothetical protein B5X24_HaOG207698 [Helicoverpa armigera]|uniref:Uncharacterized protein n=1 Tax=Helicoverpa armigera TaxID=29058 RepID=A0A2W1BJR2_HELAM|nr:hypothetical protein B5X24_HaOG207698 [Helicoverpa armigera]